MKREKLTAVTPDALRLVRAAARYCAAKDRERHLANNMRRCERHTYPVDPQEEEGIAPEQGPEVPFCSRQCDQATSIEDWEPLPVEQWCQSCRDNLPAVVELRKVRASMGGLASAMRQAARKVQP